MKALLDTNVLYPTVMREILLGCAAAGLYQPLWSPRILDEWRHVAARGGPADLALAEGEIARLGARFPRALVRPRAADEARLHLPDAADVHVLAAAIAGSADVLVTQNRADFPRGLLTFEGLARTDADAFLWRLWSEAPDTVARVVDDVRLEAERLSGEDWPTRRLLKKARLPRLGKALAG
ncbi:RSP_2648 family PIN domain-containing protein [Palleronia sp. KMU-117]|uniref:RSP_2648 family PIN domain-containing protein n=1 Tax=Palleronia sp. KMU-117 TaxID=3434108 RepID=UPI003D73F810